MSEQPDDGYTRQQRMAEHTGLEVTRSQVVRLADVALTTSAVQNRVFVECLILGPAVVAPLEALTISGCSFDGTSESMFLLLPEEQNTVMGVIALYNAHFYDCRFQNVAILGKAAALEQFRQGFPTEDQAR